MDSKPIYFEKHLLKLSIHDKPTAIKCFFFIFVIVCVTCDLIPFGIVFYITVLSNLLYSEKFLMDNLESSEGTDELHHNAAFHRGPQYLMRLKQPSGTEIHHNVEVSACYPF